MSGLLPISEVRRLAAIHGGDPEPVIAARADKAEALLRQIACNTDAEWGRKLACDYLGVDVLVPPPEEPTQALVWLPMETAPRDDTDVLLRFARRRPAIGWRAGEEWLSSDSDDPLPSPIGWMSLDILMSAPPSVPAPPPIPAGVYYRAESDNFHDMTANVGMGMAFWTKWRARKHEFPTERGAST